MDFLQEVSLCGVNLFFRKGQLFPDIGCFGNIRCLWHQHYFFAKFFMTSFVSGDSAKRATVSANSSNIASQLDVSRQNSFFNSCCVLELRPTRVCKKPSKNLSISSTESNTLLKSPFERHHSASYHSESIVICVNALLPIFLSTAQLMTNGPMAIENSLKRTEAVLAATT